MKIYYKSKIMIYLFCGPKGERKRGISGAWGIFRAEKVFCVIPQLYVHDITH